MKVKIGLLLVTLCLLFIQSDPAMANGDYKEQQMIEVRQKYFGEGNVNPETGSINKDKVILSWTGVSNFAAAINGKVVLLDAWIPGGTNSDYVPATVEELALLKPEAVFVGHAHYDHTDDAAEIIEKTGAKLIGTPEHCESIQADARDKEKVSCIHAVPAGAAPGTTGNLSFLEGVEITALSHVHSKWEHPDLKDPSKPIFPKANWDKEKSPGPADTKKLLGAIGEDEGGTLLYQFQVRDFSFTWNDSAGPIKEQAPQLMDIMNSMQETDVQAGAIMGFNQYSNGLRDPRMYIEALNPKVFIPTHHDNWSPPITTNGANYEVFLNKELEFIEEQKRPELLFLSDPEDYVRPDRLTFDINDPKWK